MLAKPGKRMNQVLYMNYVIGSLDKSLRDAYTDRGSGSLGVRKIPTLTNTLLLTTDGDTSFDFKNVDVLVDTMVSYCTVNTAKYSLLRSCLVIAR